MGEETHLYIIDTDEPAELVPQCRTSAVVRSLADDDNRSEGKAESRVLAEIGQQVVLEGGNSSSFVDNTALSMVRRHASGGATATNKTNEAKSKQLVFANTVTSRSETMFHFPRYCWQSKIVVAFLEQEYY
ncbi:hypothetical protein Q1695_015067 [Nippostrongylus brasiliensis]|nr:hypothetical protein Q1695_015067 [Nippostrongylus brasiliensis]